MYALNQLASGWTTWLVAVTWQLAALAIIAWICDTSQRLALPPEWIEQRIAAAVKDQDAGLEQRLQYYRSRAEN